MKDSYYYFSITELSALDIDITNQFMRVFVYDFKALLENGQTLTKFVATYRETIAKVQRRYGNIETSCRLDLRQLNVFMNEKLSKRS